MDYNYNKNLCSVTEENIYYFRGRTRELKKIYNEDCKQKKDY